MTAIPDAPPPTGRRGTGIRPATLPVPVLAALAVGVVALGVAGAAAGEPAADPLPLAATVTLAVAFSVFGLFLARRLPGNALGRLMAFVGAGSTAAALADCWSAQLWAAWAGQWLWLPPLGVIPLLLVIAPDGHLPSPRWRPVVGVLVVATAVATAGFALAALSRPRSFGTVVGEPLPSPARELLLVGLGALALLVVASLGVGVLLVRRWMRAVPVVRRQLECLLPSVVLLVVGIVLDALGVLPYVWVAALAVLPLGLTVAVLRFRLHDLDLYVHRGTVWLVLTALSVGVFAVVVTAAGALLQQPGSPTASLLGAAAVAALLQPLQRATQRAVDRLLYGRRSEPYAVLTGLGRHLTVVRDPLAVLPQIVETLVESLRVPYAAMRVTADDGSTSTAAEHGRRVGVPERFPMQAHGRPVGELLVAPRQAGTRFSTAEARLLGDLAGQAALAVEACRHAIDLQRARDRLVLAREEERRRLRRDLHDGVAAALVGSRMLTAAARQAVTEPDSARAPHLLDVLAEDLETCTQEVRTLIDGLRPPSLDHGLGVALAQLVDRAAGPTRLTLVTEGDLVELPAAVEVAAYRVVVEALTNVAKHARAATCRVTVRRSPESVDVEVLDDGTGFIDVPDCSGVGLASIRSRVEELTGRVTVASGRTGTRLEVTLPLTTLPLTTLPMTTEPLTAEAQIPSQSMPLLANQSRSPSSGVTVSTST